MDLGGRGEVQSARHVVRDDHARPLRHRAGDLKALAISARERGRERLRTGRANAKRL